MSNIAMNDMPQGFSSGSSTPKDWDALVDADRDLGIARVWNIGQVPVFGLTRRRS